MGRETLRFGTAVGRRLLNRTSASEVRILKMQVPPLHSDEDGVKTGARFSRGISSRDAFPKPV